MLLTVEHVEVIEPFFAGDGDEDEGAENGQSNFQMGRHDDDVTRDYYGHCVLDKDWEGVS